MSSIQRVTSIFGTLLRFSAVLLSARFGTRLLFSRGGVPGPPTVPVFPDQLQEGQGQPKETLVGFLDMRPGMKVVVVGPEPRDAVLRAAQQVGSSGQVMVINAQRPTVEGLKPKLDKMQLENVIFQSASPYDLPLPEDYADRAILVAILNRIADQRRALKEVQRVLKSEGVMGVEQRLVDIGLPRQSKVTGWCQEAGFEPVARHGSQMHYLLTFRPRLSK